MTLRHLGFRICTLLIAAFVPLASAEAQYDTVEFARPGFYAGIGGTAAFPQSWNGDLDNDLNEEATELATASAIANLDASPSILDGDDLVPLLVAVNDSALEEALMGVNGVVGYRAGQRAAFEVEAEWLIDSAKTSLDVTSLSEFPMSNVIAVTSSGAHTAEVETIWTLTANAKIYAPLTGRYQPFAKVGVGVQHSTLVTDITTSGLTTIAADQNQTLVVAADFRLKSRESNLDGALRVGAGIDVYATPNIVAELGVGYVVPFSEVGSIVTDYVAVQWRLVYRF